MAAAAEHIEHIALRDLVLGENPRTVRPSPKRVHDHARSIAHCGILVPLVAYRVEGQCHLLAGHTRLAALCRIADDRPLRELAEKNGVDIHHVPVIFFTGDEQSRLLLPIVENNLHDLMNEMDVATRVQLLLDRGTDPAMLEHFFGYTRFSRFPMLLALPPELRQWIKEGRLKPTTAIKLAKLYHKRATLVRKARAVLAQVDHLCANGNCKIARVTEGIFTGKQGTMRVVNEVTASLHASKWECPEARAVYTMLHGLQLGMKGEELVQALVSGRDIPEPPKKKRGRKPKTPKTP